MTTYKRGDRFRDPEGRVLELVERTDPRGDVPPYWRAVTVVTATGVDASTGLPVSDERPGRGSTIREDRLSEEYERVKP